MVAATAWLVALNYNSEKVMQSFLTAAAVGTLGVLITILYGLDDDIRKVEFPALFTYEKISLTPLGVSRNLGYLPPSEKWAAMYLSEIEKVHPEAFTKEKSQPGMDMYGDIALRLVFDSLHDRFGIWDVKVIKTLPWLGEQIGGYDEHSPKSHLIPWGELSAQFPNSYAIRIPPSNRPEIALPPNTRLSSKDERFSTGGFQKITLFLVNDFVNLEIVIKLRGGSIHTGVYGFLPTIPNDDVHLWTASYHISMKAELNKYRSGHPQMPKYQAWTDNVFEAVRDRLDSQRHWEQNAHERHQALETKLGAKIDKVEQALNEVQKKSDEILINLSKPKKQQ